MVSPGQLGVSGWIGRVSTYINCTKPRVQTLEINDESNEYQCVIIHQIRHGLVARIAGSHPAGPGSTPGVGTLFPRGLTARISSSLSLSSLLLDDDDDFIIKD